MKSVLKEIETKFEDRKSEFITNVKPVSNVMEANEFINKIKNKYPDATHNVPVYRVIEKGQEYFKYSDDGEPQDTAGKPAAEVVKILEIYNIALVITRYYGGIKLGAGGLIRNYAKASKLGIEEANIVDYIEYKSVIIDFDYSKTTEIETYIKKENIEIIEQNYAERITMKLNVTNDQLDTLKEIQNIIVMEL